MVKYQKKYTQKNKNKIKEKLKKIMLIIKNSYSIIMFLCIKKNFHQIQQEIKWARNESDTRN